MDRDTNEVLRAELEWKGNSRIENQRALSLTGHVERKDEKRMEKMVIR